VGRWKRDKLYYISCSGSSMVSAQRLTKEESEV
jgi:hypothetical protein